MPAIKPKKSSKNRVAKHNEQPRTRDDDALQRILRFQTERYEAGRLIELDAPEGVVILVKEGRVLATTVDHAGQETLCVLRDSGSVIGLESLSGMVLPYFLWTMTDVELAVAPATQGREWLRGQNQAVQAVVRTTAESLGQSLNEQMALHGSAQTRLARLILSAAEGDKDAKGPASVMLALPKNVLARMLQMRAETMSRVLKKLEEAGAIALTPKIEVRSTKKLAELIESRSGD
jgi:CRP-like cAMP-binding protein